MPRRLLTPVWMLALLPSLLGCPSTAPSTYPPSRADSSEAGKPVTPRDAASPTAPSTQKSDHIPGKD